jgi:hypothetical protein
MKLQKKSIFYFFIEKKARILFRIIILLLFFSIITIKAEVASRYKINNPEGIGEIFLGGVYIYANSYGDKVTMDAHLRHLAQNGITHVYLTTSTSMTDPTMSEVITMCEKYGLRISFQIESAYISSINDFTTSKAQAAANFINAYDTSAVLAYSVREEPPSNTPDSFIDSLLNHYANITSYCTNYDSTTPAPMYLLQSNISAIEDANANTSGQQPIATGADRYFVRWHFSDIGYIATPSKVLALQGQSNGFPAFLAETQSDQYFTAVFTCNTQQETYTKSYLQSTYPTKYSRWLTLAQNDNQGLSEDGDNIKIWSFYSPPKNLIRATMWQTIAFGSHGIMNWSCNPTPGSSSFNGLLGPDFKGGDAFDEFTSTVRELQPYAWIINRMSPSTNDGVTNDPTSLIWDGNFSLSNYTAHITVIVNGDVGTWANDSKTTFLNDSQTYRIDSDGELIDYTPYTTARTVTLTNQQTNMGSMYDLSTGQLIGSTSGTVDLEPGQGKFIWIGSQSNLEEIRLLCGFAGLTKLVGYMKGATEIPQDIRTIWPVDEFFANSGHIVKSQDVELDQRYRLHITASSPDGTQLGAYLSLYDSSWQPVGGSQIGIWNKSLSSSPQTFISDTFRVDSSEAAHARVHFYRTNRSGTLNIQDAWLEDIEHHEYLTNYYDNYNTIQLVPSKTYRVHVIAKKLDSNYDNSGLGIFCYNYRQAGGGVEMYRAVNKYWNLTALEEDPNEFVSNTFTAYDGQAIFLTIGIYNIHYNRDDGETVVIEKAWVEEVQ